MIILVTIWQFVYLAIAIRRFYFAAASGACRVGRVRGRRGPRQSTEVAVPHGGAVCGRRVRRNRAAVAPAQRSRRS